MTKNMLEILKNIDSNKGQVINSLIKSNVLTVKDIVSAAIESKNPSIIFSVTAYTNGLNNEDIDKLADAVIATEDAKYIYSFARYIKGAPLEKLADAIIATKDARYIYEFACGVNGAPIEKLAKAIIATGNMEYINLFVQETMAKLIKLANNGDLKTIESGADTYRSLLLGTEDEVQEKPKTKVRKIGNK